MATVSTNQNINAVVYASGENITIDSGAVLTVDAQVPADVTALLVRPGIMACITSGRLRIVNTSTTTPLVFSVLNNGDDYRFERNGVFEIKGAPIVLGTGTGASQTFDLSVAPYDTMPYPSYVEVETGNGTDVYTPFRVVCTAGKTVTFPTTNFAAGASYEVGDVLFWDATTRILTSGDDVNGNSIPIGARVRVPNIYIHSDSTNTTPSSRSLIDLSPSGTIDAEWCAFSDHIYFSNSAFGGVTFKNCGFAGDVRITSSNGAVELDHVSVSPDTQQTTAAQAFQVNILLGPTKVNKVKTLMGGLVNSASKNILGQLFALTSADNTPKIEDCFFSIVNGATTSSNEALNMTNIPSSTVITNLGYAGGRIELNNTSNVDIVNLRAAFRHDTTQSTTAVNGISFVNCQNINFIGLFNSGPAAFRSAFFSTDSQSSNINVFGVDYDCANNTGGVLLSASDNVSIFNSTFRNVRTGNLFSDVSTTFLASRSNILNCRATSAGTLFNDPVQNANYDLIPGQPQNFNTAFSGASNFTFANLVDLGLAPTTGSVVCGPWGNSDKVVLGGQAQLDQAGLVEMFFNGDSIEIETIYPMHGITSFQNASPTFTYAQDVAGVGTTFADSTTPPNDVTVEFAVSNFGEAFGAYQTLNASNLSTAIAGLTGYDSAAAGLGMKIRLTATTDDAFRTVNQVYVLTNIDNTYAAPNVSFNLLGPDSTDVIRVYLNEGGGPSTDTLIAEFTGSGVQSFSGSVYYNEEIYFVRLTSTGATIMSTRPNPVRLILGDNGDISLFAGAEVQLAQSPQITDIKALVDLYLDAAISSRVSEADQAARHFDVEADLETINNGIKKASLLIPHNEDLP